MNALVKCPQLLISQAHSALKSLQSHSHFHAYLERSIVKRLGNRLDKSAARVIVPSGTITSSYCAICCTADGTSRELLRQKFDKKRAASGAEDVLKHIQPRASADAQKDNINAQVEAAKKRPKTTTGGS